MFKLALFACIAVASLALPIRGVRAADNGSHAKRPINWQQRDTAVYVVSTLNLLRTDSGRPITSTLTARLGVGRYAVYSDQAHSDLYFIVLKRSDGTGVGALAYQMGWSKPQSVSDATNALGIHSAPDKIVQAYRIDPKQWLASFKSTLPSY